jgi:hypothetical protein
MTRRAAGHELADKWRKIPKGRIAVLDASFKFEALAAKYVDSQSQELADLAGTDICIAFGMPPWKLGLGDAPGGHSQKPIQVIYLQDCLQWQVEEIEQCLDHGLDIPADVYVELDPACLAQDGQQDQGRGGQPSWSRALRSPTSCARGSTWSRCPAGLPSTCSSRITPWPRWTRATNSARQLRLGTPGSPSPSAGEDDPEVVTNPRRAAMRRASCHGISSRCYLGPASMTRLGSTPKAAW